MNKKKNKQVETKGKTKKKKSTKKPQSKRGAKSKYDERLPSIVKYLRRNDYTIEKIAEILQCNKDTLYNWAKVHPEFSDALKEGRGLANAQAADSLFMIANGFEYTETKEQVEYIEIEGQEGTPIPAKKIKRERTKKYFPPNFPALQFYLTNRAPEDWKNQTQNNVSGSVDHNHSGSIQVNTVAALAADAKEGLIQKQLSLIQGGKKDNGGSKTKTG